MCRFVCYIGKDPIFLNQILEEPSNSLIDQSRAAKEGSFGINADGFGLAWYDHCTDDIPGIFKSTQPAWNDSNLRHISRKIKSNCFLGHVRASTVGDVTLSNCHPFAYKQYSMVHNGTIENFQKIRRSLINELEDHLLNEVKAQTDSEHLFFLIMHFLHNHPASNLEESVKQAFDWIVTAQEKVSDDDYSTLNIVITDGSQLISTRFVTKSDQLLTLYYSCGDKSTSIGDNWIIASEPLTDCRKNWTEVPVNQYLVISADLSMRLESF